MRNSTVVEPKISSLKSAIIEQNKESVFLQEGMAEARDKISGLTQNITSLERNLATLEQQDIPQPAPSHNKFDQLLDDLDQRARLSNLQFMGFTTATTTNNFLQTLNDKFKTELTSQDFQSIFQIDNTNKGSRMFKAVFTDVNLRQAVYRKRTSLTKSDFSIAEDLTKPRAETIKVAREAKKAKKVESAWTDFGIIKIKKVGEKRIYSARTIAELQDRLHSDALLSTE